MTRFATCIQALRKLTNWTALSKIDETGQYHVELEDGIELYFGEQNHDAIIMKSVVYEMPFDRAREESLLRTCGRLMMAVRRERRSQLTLETTPDNGIRCLIFRKVASSVAVDQFLREVEDWINDVAWWKRNIQSALSAEQEKGSTISSLMSTAFLGTYN